MEIDACLRGFDGVLRMMPIAAWDSKLGVSYANLSNLNDSVLPLLAKYSWYVSNVNTLWGFCSQISIL